MVVFYVEDIGPPFPRETIVMITSSVVRAFTAPFNHPYTHTPTDTHSDRVTHPHLTFHLC